MFRYFNSFDRCNNYEFMYENLFTKFLNFQKHPIDFSNGWILEEVW